jgi:acid phosphatase type 7
MIRAKNELKGIKQKDAKVQRRKEVFTMPLPFLCVLAPLRLCVELFLLLMGNGMFIVIPLLSFGFLHCEPFDPRVVYLSWLQDPDTTMAVQWITEGDQDPHDDLFYQEVMDPNEHNRGWQIETGKHYPLPGEGRYLLHRVELIHLKPHAAYWFKIGINGKQYKFRTMPAVLDAPIRFVVGGDMYQGDIRNVIDTNRMAAKYNPDFALAGGDLAYAVTNTNFKAEGVARWITWLEAWKQSMITNDGRMIPLLAAIGNHDVEGRFGQTPAQAPIFYLLFRGAGQAGYEVVDFGSYLSLFILDTGHTTSIPSQALWLANELGRREAVTHKMAMYHVPAYPSRRDFHNSYSAAIRKYWVPLFEKFHLDVAFEHHDHDYKRTHPLLKGHVDAMGVIYMGDGAWGVAKPRKPRKSLYYLARSAPVRHFIGVTLQNESRRMQAISSKGELIDEVQQAVK